MPRFGFEGVIVAESAEEARALLTGEIEKDALVFITKIDQVETFKPRDDNGNYVVVPVDTLAGKMFYVEPPYPGLRRDVVELVREDGEVFWISAQGDVPLVVTTLGEND